MCAGRTRLLSGGGGVGWDGVLVVLDILGVSSGSGSSRRGCSRVLEEAGYAVDCVRAAGRTLFGQ